SKRVVRLNVIIPDRDIVSCELGEARQSSHGVVVIIQYRDFHRVARCSGRVDGFLWKYQPTREDQSHPALMLIARITLPHFSVSSAMNLPKSAGDNANTVPPKSGIRAFILGSARPALISLLSLSTISAGVPFGAPTP